MKELPILFSTEMVQAILAGNKCQTRRTRGLEIINKNPDDYEVYEDKEGWHYCHKTDQNSTGLLKYPFGWPGDLLYVRETWKWEGDTVWDDAVPMGYFLFKADDQEGVIRGWKPSIHMPKKAARIWLEVTGVRLERIHEITEEDALAEGVEFLGTDVVNNHVKWVGDWYQHYLLPDLYMCATARLSFETLWCKINGHESWDQNPWVWVIESKVLSTTGRP